MKTLFSILIIILLRWNFSSLVPKPLAKHYLIKRVTSGLGSLMKCAAALSSSWVPQSRLLLSTVANTSSEHLPLVGIANSLDASSSGEDSSRLSSVNLGEDDDASSSNIINNNNDNDPSSSSAEATPPALDSQFSNSTITRENSMTRDSIPASTPLLHSQSFSSLTTIFKTCGGSNTLPENEYTESRIAAFQYLHTLLANQWKFASEEQGVQISVMDSSSLSNHSPNIPVVKGDMDRIVSSHGSENATTKAINDWVNTVKCPEARKIWEPKLGFEEARVLEWFHSNECVFQSFQR